MTHDPFEAADRLAPVPARRDAPVDDWVRHHAATALAAWAVFHAECRNIPRNPEPGSRPDIGYLAALGAASTHAAVALNTHAAAEPSTQRLWDLTPEAGALNGESEEWVVAVLDELGVNPADINPAYVAADFRSPTASVDQGQSGTAPSTEARAGYETAIATLRGVEQRTGSPAARWAADYLAADPDKLAPVATAPNPPGGDS